MFEAVFDQVVEVTAWLTGPGRPVLAICIGLIVSWCLTQYLKKHFLMAPKIRVGLAFILGATATFMSMPAWTFLAFWTSVAVGMAAPTLYKFLVMALKKVRPGWASALSADKEKP